LRVGEPGLDEVGGAIAQHAEHLRRLGVGQVRE
jgi:hypothetical protein